MPNRFKGIRPCLKLVRTAAWINPSPEQGETTETAQPRTVNS
jgi:putative transposase